MKADCKQSFVGRYWFGVVDGKMKCHHLHKTPKAARRCAEQWIKANDPIRESR